MTWLVALLVAAAAFAVAVLAFRLPRATWTSLAAALVFGLAGYTLQASPTIPAAPKADVQVAYVDEWEIIPSRQLLVAQAERSPAPAMITGDAFARQGQFADAAVFYRGIVEQNPQDFEGWVALGNALTEQADGQLTQASIYALRQANQLRPTHPAPSYFLGLSLIRQGRMMEARGTWQQALDAMGPASGGDDPARAFMTDRLARIDAMLQQMGAVAPSEAEQP